MRDTCVADKLKNCLQECLQTLANENVLIPLVYNKIQEALERLSQPMQLAIIGKISSSKSTLVNAVLGKEEVVRTGQMEETFNVSWLKYGDPNSDIKVVFKNGEIKYVPNKDWAYWTSHQHGNVLKEQVKYIEASYNDPILKKINIIDTPGLDALSEIDSKNTIAFLKEVKPDAVVMLFTKSIAESTFSILQDFQNVGSNTFSLTPLNAIGVLAKVDTLWSSMNPQNDVLADAKRVIQHTLYDKYPEVKRSLFSILPVSSLLGLSSSTITDRDFDVIKRFSKIESSILYEMLSSPDLLIDEDYKVDVSTTERLVLYHKFGLYGIYVLVNALWSNPNCTLSDAKNILKDKSGFDRLLKTIISHFGDRAALIKSQNTIVSVIEVCKQVSSSCCDAERKVVESITRKITTALLSMHEFQEWRFLSDIYENPSNYENIEVDEFKALCGEYGSSVIERLQLPANTSVSEMIETIKNRSSYWRKRYNIYSDIDPHKAALYKVILSSYNALQQDVESVYVEARNAEAVLNNAREFLLGIKTKKYSEIL